MVDVVVLLVVAEEEEMEVVVGAHLFSSSFCDLNQHLLLKSNMTVAYLFARASAPV